MATGKKPMKEAAKSSGQIYQFKISLLEVQPEIWRRFQVKSDITLAKLNTVIQTVMGWTDTHLHQFLINGICYCPPDSEMESDFAEVNEAKVKLSDVVKKVGDIFQYDYDFGDGWEHILTLEKIEPAKKDQRYPVCLEGARSCPPEDCGGSYGYEELLEVISDPDREDHEEMVEWVGDQFDPDCFELKWINEDLKNMR